MSANVIGKEIGFYKFLSILLLALKNTSQMSGYVGMAQLAECLTLDFSSGPGLWVMGLKPYISYRNYLSKLKKIIIPRCPSPWPSFPQWQHLATVTTQYADPERSRHRHGPGGRLAALQ